MSNCARISALLLLLSAVGLQAADWPQWGGTAAKNMVSSERNLPQQFSPNVEEAQSQAGSSGGDGDVLWTAQVGNFCCGTPAVSQGRLFIAGMYHRQGIMKCFDEATGQLLWQWVEPCRSDLKEDAMNFRHFPKSLGICSTPAVEGDRLYFVDQNCVVQCMDVDGQSASEEGEPGQGKVIWSFDMYAAPAVKCRPSDACNGSPLIDGDILYVTTSNGVDRIVRVPIEEDAARRCFAPDAPTLIALDKRTGRFLARDTAPTAAGMLHGQWSSPSMGVVNGRKLIFLGGGDGNCYAFEALSEMPESPVLLKTAWWVDCNPPEYRDFGGLDMITHYTLGDKRRRDTLNTLNDGSFVGMSEIIATPVFYNDRVYVAIGRDPDHGRGRGALLCLDADQYGDSTQTAIAWTYQGLDRSLSTASICDGLIYVADVAGKLHCLDVNTGEVCWVFESNSRTIASTLAADGKVYLPTEGQLNVLAAGRKLHLLSQIDLGAPSWVTPVAANGRLFIASRSRVWALTQSP